MENEMKNNQKKNNGEKSLVNLPLIIGGVVGVLAVVAIVLAIVFGGKGDDNDAGSGQGGNPPAGDVDNGDGENGGGILNEDNIDPEGWTEIEK